jgi:hypothetical protein
VKELKKIYLPKRERKISYPKDVQRIIRVLKEKGYECDEELANSLWRHFSDLMCAGWLVLPKEDSELFNDLQRVFHEEV